MHVIYSIYLNSWRLITAIPKTIQSSHPVAPASAPSAVLEPFDSAAAGLRSSSSPEPVERRWVFTKNGNLKAIETWGKCGKMKVSSVFKNSWPFKNGR